MPDKGNCPKHGEFVLMDGCPQCLADKKAEQRAVPPPLPPPGPEVFIEKGFPALPSPEPVTTAIVAIVPSQDTEVLKIHAEILKARDRAVAMKVDTHEEAKMAVNDLSCIKVLRQNLEVKRKGFVDPHRAYIKEVNDAFKIFEAPIIEADQSLRGKWTTFKLKQEAIRQRALEAVEAQLIADAKAKDVRETTGELIEKPKEAPVVVPDASTKTQTEMGSAGLTAHWKHKVVDFALLSDDYKLPDTKVLNAIARTHHDNKKIPGVEFYNEPSPSLRTKGGE